MADHSGKTEQPTQRRLEKARREGQFPAARELISALQFLIFLVVLGAGGAGWFNDFKQTARELFTLAFHSDLNVENLNQLVWRIGWRHFLPLAIGGMALVAASLAFRLVTTRFGISFKKLAPDGQRFKPISKFRELPRQNLPALVQAVLLLPVFLWADRKSVV